MNIGTSEQTVLDFVNKVGVEGTIAQHVGDALYAKTSKESSWTQVGDPAEAKKVRRNWARKLLNKLAKKGLIVKTTGAVPVYNRMRSAA